MTSESSGSNAVTAIAFDTTAYSHLVRGNDQVAALFNKASLVVMPQPTIAELKSGFTFGSLQEVNEANLARFLASDKILVVYPDEVTTQYYVALCSHARRVGRHLSNNDLWIAALSAQYNAQLLSFDHDFDGLINYDGLNIHILD